MIQNLGVAQQHDVTFPAAGGAPMRASLALPDAAGGARPGVLVLHELFGLNDDIRRITARFADAGYVAMAPDLYDGPGPRLLCIARTMWALRRGRGRAFSDLDAARAWLGRREEVDASRMAVAGFCMGGSFVLLYAVRAPLGVAAPFYGEVPKTADALRGICPVVGGYGGRDRIFAPHGRRLRAHLEALGVDHDVELYDEAGHSFMSRHDPGLLETVMAAGPMKVGYNDAAAEDSWRRMLAFFGRHLNGAA